MIELIIFSSIVFSWLLFLYCVRISPSPVFKIDKELLKRYEKRTREFAEKLNSIGVTVQQANEAFQKLSVEFAKIKLRRPNGSA